MASPLIKVSDYVAQAIADRGLKHVFMLTGGGAMHLNDSLGHEPRLTYICNHHEQACSIAAEAYARVSNRPAVVNVTTGPGGINAINGVFCAFTDSIPMLVISGQVRRDTLISSHNIPGLRQLGDQEVDIISMVKGITKYAALVTDPATVPLHLEKALHFATTGRPGPCWLDIPIDVQGSKISVPTAEANLQDCEATALSSGELARVCQNIVARFKAARRPVILLGSGVRLARALEIFEMVANKLGVPITTAWTAIDAIASDHPLYCGRPGTVGDRAGNFAVQNADLLLIIGSRLPIRQVSYNWHSFAQRAYKIIVDIDQAELLKPFVKADLAVHCDARVFLQALNQIIDSAGFDRDMHQGWVAWNKKRVAAYPVVQPRQRVVLDRAINPYGFMESLFDRLLSDDVIVCGDATASVVAFQAAKIKKGQLLFTNAGCAPMGYDLPAAVGAAVAREGKRVICLAGDGSLQLNIQELQTIAHHQLPIKVFVLNNDGYLSMRQTQSNFFKRLVGEGPSSGVSFPDVVAVARAYGLPAERLEGPNYQQHLDEVLATPGPGVFEVVLDREQPFEPKLSSKQLPDGKIVSAALEDLSPFLDPSELRSNMLT